MQAMNRQLHRNRDRGGGNQQNRSGTSSGIRRVPQLMGLPISINHDSYASQGTERADQLHVNGAEGNGRGRGREIHIGNRGQRGGRGGNRGGNRSGRGGRGGHGDHARPAQKLEQFGFKNLKSMAEKDPDELVLDMTSDKCFPATENLVNDLYMDDGKVVVVLKVFANACDCTTATTWLIKLLTTLPKSNFLSFHLSNYINRLPNLDDVDSIEREQQLTLMIKLCAELLRKFPSCFADLPFAQLYMTITSLNSTGKLLDQRILSEVEALGRLKDEMSEKIKKESEEANRKPRRRNARTEGIRVY